MNKLEGTLPYVGLLAFSSMALTRVCDPMLTTLGSEFGVSIGQASRVISWYAIAYGALQLVWGPLGDRLGKLRIVGGDTIKTDKLAKVAGLVGAFVLVFIGVLLSQIDLVNNLQSEIAKRQQEEARRMALEKALAIPLQSGRVTLDNGRIGISGSVLFDFNSDQLRPEGQQLLKSLVPPLEVYLGERDEMLMVSGFTDDKTIVKGPNQRFEDNLELSAQRALTVTRTLVKEGMPRQRVFSAAFGAEQPVASNADEKGRALNRRVEMAPVPRAAPTPSTAAPAAATAKP